MADYRDIGRLNNGSITSIEVNSTRRGQVYQATHNGEGQTLPYMNRSFISFTYGGKAIEEFDLIATQNDRLDRDGYASFNDNTSDYDNLEGQYYWSTHYKTNSLSFTLSTDGIDQKNLDAFLHWFKAGISKELILAEHPNRAIMARVAQPPHLNLMPFETTVEMKISSVPYKVKTTLYKGDIELELVMDQPHWYAIQNVLGKKTIINDRERYENTWYDITTKSNVSIFASQDALKILYEDGIPLGSMIANNMLLGNGSYANVENQVESKIWSKSESDSNFADGTGARIYGTITGQENPASNYAAGNYTGVIAGAIVDASNSGISRLSKGANAAGYFFYSGTAPAPTIITFSLVPTFNDYGYINVPANSYTNSTTPYNTLTIESTTKQELRFTTPNVFTSYNVAIRLFRTYITRVGMDWETIRKKVRDSVRHPIVRAWAIKCVNTRQNNNSNLNGDARDSIITAMRGFFPNPMEAVTFKFNSETGEAFGTFQYKTDFDGNTFTIVEEDVGDMLKSNYIIIQDRNYPTSQGQIVKRTNSHPEYSHRVYHDIQDIELFNLQILYKNMYL